MWDSVLPQVEFAFNSMFNRSTGKRLFFIVYTNVPNHTVDLIAFPKPRNLVAKNMVEDYQQFHA